MIRTTSGIILSEYVLSGDPLYFINITYSSGLLPIVNGQVNLGLDRTVHMSFLTGQDWTPKFAGRVLPDRTESGLIFLNILPTNYRLLLLIR